MNFIIRQGSSISGDLLKGYLKSWDKTRNGGSYHIGRDFLSIHWEIHITSPNLVRLHVESPKAEDDVFLNLLKSRIIIGIMSKLKVICSSLKIGKLVLGKRLMFTSTCKSSEVFHVRLDSSMDNIPLDVKISMIHSEVGHIIDSIMNKYKKDIDVYFKTL